ncbi:hypothetical protein [Saccharothrix syringae]|uniref:Vegetative cell wall protein gp1 n=1 Tax=Saccharothrix syringae TaxID=103733 RepID=A0A5Q0GYH5_SACSY|nr:hypothetical protein [Saccharothrix syringae]QFZ18544.1 hypothetical protein EKG83_14680 [Saccharothrix syringae]
MNPFLQGLGGKLAERWVTALVLPGALFVVAVVCAIRLGHHNALDVVRVGNDIVSAFPRLPLAVAAVGMLLGAAAAAFTAQALGTLVQAVWVKPWRGPAAWLARLVVAVRGWRFDRAAAKAGVDPVPAYRPQRATWIGERFRLLDTRVAAQYQGLRLGPLWPRLWLLVPESARLPVQTAEIRFHSSTTLTGWGVLYGALGPSWYPAAVIGFAVAVVGWRRSRAGAAALTELIEATVDTHLDVLTTSLGAPLPATGLTRDLAARINDRFTKGE